MVLHAGQFIVLALAGWLNRQQQDIVAYLSEANRVPREQFTGRRLRFADDQRRRLAAKGKALGSKVLGETSTLVTPETVLRWYWTLIAKKHDGSAKRWAVTRAGVGGYRSSAFGQIRPTSFIVIDTSFTSPPAAVRPRLESVGVKGRFAEYENTPPAEKISS